MPDRPGTHNHRRTVIDPNDSERIEHDTACRHEFDVADLLDAIDALPDHLDDCAEWDYYDHAWLHADGPARASARAIDYARKAAADLARRLAALSPEERAEYERRTT